MIVALQTLLPVVTWPFSTFFITVYIHKSLLMCYFFFLFRRMVRLLKETKGNVTYSELPGKEHWWWDTW